MNDGTATIKIVFDRSQADRDLASLTSELNGLGKTNLNSLQASIDRLTAAIEGLGGAYSETDAAVQTVTRSHQKLTASLGNARLGMMEFQHITRGVTDGLAAGASPMQVFSMHVGMLGEAMAMSGSTFGKFGEFLAGPWGLAITAAISVGAMLISHIKLQGNEVDDLVGKLKQHQHETELSAEADRIWANSLDGLIAQQEKLNEQLDRRLTTQRALDQKALHDAQTSIGKDKKDLNDAIDAEKKLEKLRPTLVNATQNPDSDAALEAQRQLQDLDGRIAVAKKKVNDLTRKVNGESGTIAKEQITLGQEDGAALVDLTKKSQLWAEQYESSLTGIENANNHKLAPSARTIEAGFNAVKNAFDDAAAAGVDFTSKMTVVKNLGLDLQSGKLNAQQYADAMRGVAKSTEDAVKAQKDLNKESKETEKYISPQDAIVRLGKELQAKGMTVSENPAFGGVTPGVHHGLGHEQGRAIDVNSVSGDETAVAWAKAKDTAVAIIAAEKGFIALFDHERYASDGHGGYTTSPIPAGQDQHTSHLHIEAQGRISPNGLKGVGESSLEEANNLKKQADELADANKQYDGLMKKNGQLLEDDSVRARLMNQMADRVTTIYAKSLAAGTISKEDVDNKVKAAQALEEQNILSSAAEKINKDNLKDYQDEAKLRDRLALTAAGHDSQLLQMAQQQADADRLDAAMQQEKNKLLAEGLVESDAEYKTQMDIYRAHELTVISLEHQIDLAKQFNEEYKNALQSEAARGNVSAGFALNQLNFQDRMAAAAPALQARQAHVYTLTGAARDAEQAKIDLIVKSFKDDMDEANQKVAGDFYNQFVNIADDIGKIFKGQFGQVLGSLVKGIGGLVSQLHDANGKAIYNPNGTPSAVGGLLNKFQGLSNNLESIFGTSGNPGASRFFQGLSQTLGQAAGGAQTGAAIGQIGTAIAPKHFSQTGSEIGGAIGSFLPIPGGDIIGSIIGGVIGGLFKKNVNPTGTTKVSVDQLTGQFTASSASGNSDAAKKAATDFGNSVSSNVNQIAQALGGQIVGTFSESLRVSGKNGKDYFVDGKIYHDPQEAEFVAEQKALLATLQGVSDFTMRILKAANSTNFNSIVQVATNYENVLQQLKTMSNPMAAQIKTVVQQTDQLTKAMQQLGATTDELANVTTYREEALKQILTDNLSSLKDFQKSLSGQGSGIPDIQRLATDITQFKAMEADKLAGKTVDQNAFTQLGQEIFQLAGNIYGTSTDQFQQIRSMLMDATQGMIDAVTNDYNQAIIDATNATTAAVNVSNNYLGQIVGILNNGGGVGGAAGGGGGATGGGGGSNGSYDYSGYGGGSGTRPGTSGLSAPRLANY